MDRAARIALGEIRKFVPTSKSLEKVLLVCFGKQALEIHERALRGSGG
jgi:O-acetyl-ADP-ribose deacetylase (regulator of RNase III)